MIVEAIQMLLESLQRLGLHGAVGKKRERLAASDVAAYFKLLGEKLPVTKLSELAKSPKDVALHSAEMSLKRVLRVVQPVLVEALATHKMLAFKEGYKQTVIPPELKEADESNSDIGQKAADYAATSAAEQVSGIDATTLDDLQTVISDAIDNQLTVDQLAKQLADEIVNMTQSRARVIARTEMSDAFAQAALDKLNDYSIAYKQWISYSDCCDDCGGNDDDGAIPVDDLFSSGDDAPPAHPNCRCTIAGARAPEEA